MVPPETPSGLLGHRPAQQAPHVPLAGPRPSDVRRETPGPSVFDLIRDRGTRHPALVTYRLRSREPRFDACPAGHPPRSGDPAWMSAFWEDTGLRVMDPDDSSRAAGARPQARRPFLADFGYLALHTPRSMGRMPRSAAFTRDAWSVSVWSAQRLGRRRHRRDHRGRRTPGDHRSPRPGRAAARGVHGRRLA
jgi:hypothetical protein